MFADILQQTGARPSGKLIQMTASQALRMGAEAFARELSALTGNYIGGLNPPQHSGQPLRVGSAVEVYDPSKPCSSYQIE